MTATGSHFDFDSLRGAPLARNDIVLFGHFAILRQLRKNKEGEIQSREKCCLTMPHSSFAASGMENRAELISTWL